VLRARLRSATTTRNQRLASVHALASFVGEHSPEHIAWSGQIRSIPFKKASKAVIPYLDKPQMDALLAAPDRETAQGRRDHALLLFLYNSGARAEEAAQLLVGELDTASSSVKIRGKGGKERCCPLWPSTIRGLSTLLAGRPQRHVSFSIAAVIPSPVSASTPWSNDAFASPWCRCLR
jgi:integrase/recombinase XerD